MQNRILHGLTADTKHIHSWLLLILTTLMTKIVRKNTAQNCLKGQGVYVIKVGNPTSGVLLLPEKIFLQVAGLFAHNYNKSRGFIR